MFAVGHMALAYLISKASAKALHVNPNIPAILVLSIIPDVDILFGVEGFHRGPMHSVVVSLLLFLPLFAVYRKKAIPYFLALASHALIGDLLIGGDLQLLWPISTQRISLYPYLPTIGIFSPVNVGIELVLFTTATLVMFGAKDIQLFFCNKKTNLLLTIPVGTVLLPTFLGYPLGVPILLVVPHLFYLILFTIAVLVVVFAAIKRT